MNWSDVGKWLGANAGSGASLVGSLLTGNIPGAIAAGVALVSSATGTTDPEKALLSLQTDPTSIMKLRELAFQNEASIREHVRAMMELQLKDAQAEHEQTQLTIRSGDNAEDVVVRRTRPLQSWASLIAAFIFVFAHDIKNDWDLYVLLALLTLPWAYAGLRQIGKGFDSITSLKGQK